MADSSSPTERPQDSRDDVLVLNKDLERMIDGAENISVQLTWMGYDMVALRTSPEVGASMRKLEEAYLRPEADVKQDICFLPAVRTQQRQCDLIVCVGCPDKLAFLKDRRHTEAAAPSLT
ncbi:synaptonemal complex central element protein 3 [Lates japonicus]|uniref:Synaptonemal complex central element protein 3 n=1 Tax=Lates japonicus TaxID=270547 RepID=A0AAD3R9B0_LATJO|nr:synaptonemal complex central element protein 3 [Lates japonicus]